jgi:Protein of unknown function (DUF3311)
MTDRREVPPEWPAYRAGWQTTGPTRAPQDTAYPGDGYAYSPRPASHTPVPPAGAPYAPAPRAEAGAHPASPGPRHAPQPPARSRTRVRRADASRWHWLLLVPIVMPLIPAVYNRFEPTLFGIPFFFWGQLAFAFLASAVIAVVHLMVR